MARPLRIEYAGAVYHVTLRGDRQEAIFDDDRGSGYIPTGIQTHHPPGYRFSTA